MNYSYLTNINYNAGIYIRLSQEDKGKLYESDSESVINQKEILKNYCLNNSFNLTGIYVDDGYSGTNFDRPGFKSLLEDIKNKKINLVIVKDLSRLGRDHVMTGYYIETYFPENKVRFISIVENYDSIKNQASNDSSTFIIACNDYYSKQNSLKIRNVLDSKRKDGKFIGSSPCYGYMRDKEDKGHLVPDPDASKYVKLIFKWRYEDIGISEIATRLTKMNVPTPSAYKNLAYSKQLKDKNSWSIYSVKKILQNRMYTGDMVQHTQTNISYKSKKKITLDQNLWVVVENTHEPLVDKAIFIAINKKKENNNRSSKLITKRKRRLFEGLLYCKECGNRLGVLYRKNNNYWSVNCNKYARDPVRGNCSPRFFPYEYLEEQILKNLKESLKDLFKGLNISDLNNEIIKRKNTNTDSLSTQKENLLKEKNNLYKTMDNLYQDRVNGNITIELFKNLIKPYESKIKDIDTKLQNIDIELKTNKYNIKNIPDYTNQIKELLNINKPSRELLKTIIDRIEIDKDKNIDIEFKNKILDNLKFKYENTSKPRNPYGRYGKYSKK